MLITACHTFTALSQDVVYTPPIQVGDTASGSVTLNWPESIELPAEVSFMVIGNDPFDLGSLTCCSLELSHESYGMTAGATGMIGGTTVLSWSLIAHQFPAGDFQVECLRGGEAIQWVQFVMAPFITPEMPAISITKSEKEARA